MARPRCYAGNRDVEEAIMSSSGSTLIVKCMQLKRSCLARTHGTEMGHAWDTAERSDISHYS